MRSVKRTTLRDIHQGQPVSVRRSVHSSTREFITSRRIVHHHFRDSEL